MVNTKHSTFLYKKSPQAECVYKTVIIYSQYKKRASLVLDPSFPVTQPEGREDGECDWIAFVYWNW